MHFRKIMNRIYLILLTTFVNISSSFAQQTYEDPGAATQDFSVKLLEIMKGPVVKILAVVVLLVGVGGLLRGRHHVAISCGAAIVLLLFLPIILEYFG